MVWQVYQGIRCVRYRSFGTINGKNLTAGEMSTFESSGVANFEDNSFIY